MRRIERDERGAVAVLVAILMTALLGFAALGVDVANMASDKQQLQNGADAGALAIAQDCAADDCVGAPDESDIGLAESLGIANKPGGTLSATEPEEVTVDFNVVEPGSVTVTLKDETHHWFAGILGSESSRIRATATAAVVPLAPAGSFPLAISLCELLFQTGQTAVDPSTDIPIPPSSGEPLVIYISDPQSTNQVTPPGCEYTGPSQDIEGGFGNLQALDGGEFGCYTVPKVYTGTLEGYAGKLAYIGKAGSPDSPTCSSDAENPTKPIGDYENMLGKEIYVPVFNKLHKENGTQYYFIHGWATFVLEAYRINSGQFWQPASGDWPCKNPQQCIAGTFVDYVYADDIEMLPGVTAPNLGSSVVKLIR